MTVNLLGTLIRLNGIPLYMCPCCTGLRVWLGDGSDLDPVECVCWQFGGTRSASMAAFSVRAADEVGLPASSTYLYQHPMQGSGSMHCLVCNSKNTYSHARMMLPDVGRRCMHRVNFCRRHTPPEHVLRTVTSYQELNHGLETLAKQARP